MSPLITKSYDFKWKVIFEFQILLKTPLVIGIKERSVRNIKQQLKILILTHSCLLVRSSIKKIYFTKEFF